MKLFRLWRSVQWVHRAHQDLRVRAILCYLSWESAHSESTRYPRLASSQRTAGPGASILPNLGTGGHSWYFSEVGATRYSILPGKRRGTITLSPLTVTVGNR